VLQLRQGPLRRLHAAVGVLFREMAKFGVVGAVAFVVDVYVFNLLRTGVWPLHHAPLANKAVTASILSTSAATVVAWLGNRYWTFRHRRRVDVRREFLLFIVMNLGGLAISAGCVAISHYLLDHTSALADNVAKNIVGLMLGTIFRFWTYRRFVFSESRETTGAPPPVAVGTPIP
jgi:putative flippase GtrA